MSKEQEGFVIYKVFEDSWLKICDIINTKDTHDGYKSSYDEKNGLNNMGSIMFIITELTMANAMTYVIDNFNDDKYDFKKQYEDARKVPAGDLINVYVNNHLADIIETKKILKMAEEQLNIKEIKEHLKRIGLDDILGKDTPDLVPESIDKTMKKLKNLLEFVDEHIMDSYSKTRNMQAKELENLFELD